MTPRKRLHMKASPPGSRPKKSPIDRVGGSNGLMGRHALVTYRPRTKYIPSCDGIGSAATESKRVPDKPPAWTGQNAS